ncbi:hypothetical protein HYH02_004764 [Chlamydomonas schloesseri]|uniref:Diacylglycerol kinase n=1 Tax=Chlamydomonas schloesseri TaxID=2026947 RepID=A0A835WMA6_9CHLO|nr:hypothetical protein HYH02_004764 [Chlamydomonas schloesseri]|eukprot:KAG2450252.1 hypothetical protein HYH02_004764 [Chlamydomonas schloesseri]
MAPFSLTTDQLSYLVVFLTDPLDCTPGGSADRYASALAAWWGGAAGAISWRGGALAAIFCRVKPRPGAVLGLLGLLALFLLIVTRNVLVKLFRWYAAARGSGYVAVATQALRELHASGAFLISSASWQQQQQQQLVLGPEQPQPHQPLLHEGEAGTCVPGLALLTGSDPRAGSAPHAPAPLLGGAHAPRPAAAHRWYTPSSIGSPVVCAACFQPVVGAQGGHEQAQCCELCGVVAHGGCFKAVPHNCRLLTLVPSAQLAPSGSGSGAGGDRGKGTTEGTGRSSSGISAAELLLGMGPASTPALPLPLPHDWRPAGTTLDLILPPADTELLVLANNAAGVAPAGATGTGVISAAGAAAASTSHGPPSLCIYCGEPCEVGLLAVEPVWRCSGCRRFAHVQCWSALHPGILSAATRAALAGQSLDADDVLASPRPASKWEAAATWHQPPPLPSPGGVPDRVLLNVTHSGGLGPHDQSQSQGQGHSHGEGGPGSLGLLAAGARSSASLRMLDSLGSASPAHSPPGRARNSRGGAGVGSGSRRTSADHQHQHQHHTLGHAHTLPPPHAPPLAQSMALHGGCSDHLQTAGHNHHHHLAAGGSGLNDGPYLSAHPPGPAGIWGQAGAALEAGAGGLGWVAVRSGPGISAGGGGQWDSERLAHLDCCDPQSSLGALGAMVLPPTAVLPVLPGGGRGPSNGGGDGGPTAHRAGAAVGIDLAADSTHSSHLIHEDNGAHSGAGDVDGMGLGAAASGPAVPAAGGSGGGNSRSRKKQLARALRQAQRWYRSHAGVWHLTAPADAGAPDRWRNFRIGALPPGCKPILVCINPRSGPQVGEQLRRQLLQLLHPLQVVDLSRETPGPALRCWWGVPGLRVLAVGGDGTVGWVLGEIDAVAEQLAAAAAAAVGAAGGSRTRDALQRDRHSRDGSGSLAGGALHHSSEELAAVEAGIGLGSREPPPPPPVAVLPLGTGNDLARVLGWGGGLAALDARGGVAAVLAEVAAAASVALDRWQLAIAPSATEAAKRGRSFLPRRRAPADGKKAAPTQFKTWNNYLGIGIDSWCCLEFHRLRERYPGWFKSQLGNKAWYTGVGARDLLARSCVDLPNRVTLVCDGVEVALPPNTQGVLLLNIASYMGGVDLWGNGVWRQQDHGQEPLEPPAVRSSPDSASRYLHRSATSPEYSTPVVAGGPTLPPAAPTATTSGHASARVSIDGRSSQPHHRVSVPSGATVAVATSASSAPLAGAPGAASAGSGPASYATALRRQAALGEAAERPQSSSDGLLEVIMITGAVQLGQLTVGLARATRLCQCRSAVITSRAELPMQADGEPWMQPPAVMAVDLKGSATMLRRLDLSNATQRLAAVVAEVLDAAAARGTINLSQRVALGADMAQRLGAPHPV